MSIIVNNLSKEYGSLIAVDNISFQVPSGSLFAFLGSNGAGKSTTIGCITTNIKATEGTIDVNGMDVSAQGDKVRQQIGVVFQSSLLDPLLTVNENLMIRAGLYGIDSNTAHHRIQELSDLLGIQDFLNRQYGVLSGGQKRRADIARALIHRPPVIFLDEPTAGLDPQSREKIWSAINRLRTNENATAFLTTHYMEETERTDMVCIIDRGRIVAEGTPAELRATHSQSLLTVRSNSIDSLIDECHRRNLKVTFEVGQDEAEIAVESSAQALELLGILQVDDFEFRHGTMDDVFLSVTKELLL